MLLDHDLQVLTLTLQLAISKYEATSCSTIQPRESLLQKAKARGKVVRRAPDDRRRRMKPRAQRAKVPARAAKAPRQVLRLLMKVRPLLLRSPVRLQSSSYVAGLVVAQGSLQGRSPSLWVESGRVKRHSSRR